MVGMRKFGRQRGLVAVLVSRLISDAYRDCQQVAHL